MVSTPISNKSPSNLGAVGLKDAPKFLEELVWYCGFSPVNLHHQVPTAKFHGLSEETPAKVGARYCHAKSQILTEIPSLTFSCLDATYL